MVDSVKLPPPTSHDYDTLVGQLDKLCKEIVEDRRKVYTHGSPNVLENFEAVSKMTGIPPGAVLMVYWAKHLMSCATMLTKPDITDSERDSRFADARNYLDLGYVMFKTGRHLV